MKFKEPIIEKCPHCESKLKFTINWILEKGRVCNFCKKDLEIIRLRFQNWLDNHHEQCRILSNVVETALVIEDQFSINFDDSDLFRDEYDITVLDIVDSTKRLLEQKESKINFKYLTKQIVDIFSKMFPDETFQISLETKLRDLEKNSIN